MKLKEKKRKREVSESTEEGESKSDSPSSSDQSTKKKKKKKKKKKSKKHKKSKKKDVDSDKQKEEGEIVGSDEPLCTVKPDEIPDIPPSNFLMRQSSPKDKEHVDRGRVGDDRRHRSNYQRRPQVSRSGRKIKGRGFMRYRTPSRSRSRSRSYTPPHWRQAQARVVPLSEYQKRQFDKPTDEKSRGIVLRTRGDYEHGRELDSEERKRDGDKFKENGDPIMKRTSFDRESAAKESVSYPIKYTTKAYESSTTKWQTGDKHDWKRVPVLPLSDSYSRLTVTDGEKVKSDPILMQEKPEEDLRFPVDVEKQSKAGIESDIGNLVEGHYQELHADTEEGMTVEPENASELVVKRRPRLSSSSSENSEKHEKPSLSKERYRSPIRRSPSTELPPAPTPSQLIEEKITVDQKSSSVSPTHLKEEHTIISEPKTVETSPTHDVPQTTPALKTLQRTKSASGSPPPRSSHKKHLEKSPKHGRSTSPSPKKSFSRQRRKDGSSPKRGRSSSGTPPRAGMTQKRYSRSSPRSRRRRDSHHSRRQRSHSNSSDSGGGNRRRRHTTINKRRDVSSRYSPRGGRRRPFGNRNSRGRSRSGSSSGSRSPIRKPHVSRLSPKKMLDDKDKEIKPGQRSRSASRDSLSPPRTSGVKSPIVKPAASTTSPPIQRKLVQDYGSPSRHSDSSNASFKSRSKTPPDPSTIRRQAQIIAAYHEEEDDTDIKMNIRDEPPDEPVLPLSLGLSKIISLTRKSPPRLVPVESEHRVAAQSRESIPSHPPMLTAYLPQPVKLQLEQESAEIQDMEIDEEDEEPGLPPAPLELPPKQLLMSSASPPPQPPDTKLEVKHDKAGSLAPALPCSLEDILLPGEIREEAPLANRPATPVQVELPSMWKAIPEATQPTVEISTLELLHKQMSEATTVEPERNVVENEEKVEIPMDDELQNEPKTTSDVKITSTPPKDVKKSASRSKSRERDKKPQLRSSSRERRSRSKSRSRSRNRTTGRRRSRSRSNSRYRRSSRDSRDRRRYNRSRSRSRQWERSRRSPSRSRSRSRSRAGGRRRRSNSRSRRRSPIRGRRQNSSRYRPYIPRRSRSRRRSTPRRRRQRSDSRSRSRSRSSSRSS